eukprot:scaffold46198_cov64-Phaeocystis_antarctica.AAC.5
MKWRGAPRRAACWWWCSHLYLRAAARGPSDPPDPPLQDPDNLDSMWPVREYIYAAKSYQLLLACGFVAENPHPPVAVRRFDAGLCIRYPS